MFRRLFKIRGGCSSISDETLQQLAHDVYNVFHSSFGTYDLFGVVVQEVVQEVAHAFVYKQICIFLFFRCRYLHEFITFLNVFGVGQAFAEEVVQEIGQRVFKGVWESF